MLLDPHLDTVGVEFQRPAIQKLRLVLNGALFDGPITPRAVTTRLSPSCPHRMELTWRVGRAGASPNREPGNQRFADTLLKGPRTSNDLLVPSECCVTSGTFQRGTSGQARMRQKPPSATFVTSQARFSQALTEP